MRRGVERLAAISVVLMALIAGGDRALADPSPAVRSEIPIHEVILSDGARRYTVSVTVGGTSIEAGLDTGSVGLRVLPAVLADGDAKSSGHEDSYSFDSGAKLDGEVGAGRVAIGDLAGPITLQMVKHMGCTARKPKCPVTRVPASQYGVQGDGLPGEGFRAIIGVNMARADVDNPFKALGAAHWIVDLPRPNEGRPGRLILNPTDAEMKNFVRLPISERYADLRGGPHDAVPGCLVNLTSRAKVCSPVMLDTGAPGIIVQNGGAGDRPWPDQTPAALAFADHGGRPAQLMETFQIGSRAHASRLLFQNGEGEGALIYAGLTPYFAFSVLYDPARGEVGLKPRPPGPGGPAASSPTATP